jgi:hypothetical protein
MSYIHKYDADGKTVYLISDKASKPSGTFSIKQEYWRGRAVGRYNTVLGQINNLSWTKKETAEEEEPTEKEKIIRASKIASSFLDRIKQ